MTRNYVCMCFEIKIKNIAPQKNIFTTTWYTTVVHAIVGIGRVAPWTNITINISTIVLLGRVQFIFAVKKMLLLSNKHLRHLNEHYVKYHLFFNMLRGFNYLFCLYLVIPLFSFF